MTVKLLIFSDSHGNTDGMVRATGLERPDAIFHLGDVMRDTGALTAAFPHIPLYSVCGNCDGWGTGQEERLVTQGGKKILMMHGHTRGVKQDVSRAIFAARELGADILLYGHTHRSHCELLNGLWILNPGSARNGTYGVIALENGDTICSVMSTQ